MKLLATTPAIRTQSLAQDYLRDDYPDPEAQNPCNFQLGNFHAKIQFLMTGPKWRNSLELCNISFKFSDSSDNHCYLAVGVGTYLIILTLVSTLKMGLPDSADCCAIFLCCLGN